MNRSIRKNIAWSLSLTLGIVGCNAILDNKPGQPQGTPTDVSPTQPKADAGSDQIGDPRCAAGETMCNAICVAATDPLFGCGDPTCTPCKTAHGAPACQGNTCIVKECDPGYSDCNENPADGCETDLSQAATCGSCKAACPAASPICAASATTFQCATGCGPDAPLLCGNQCVSSVTNVSHCGACDAACPVVDQAVVACAASKCTFECRAGYHACGPKCAAVTDPNACGPACAICPVPANAAAACAADACSFTCTAGFDNCNLVAADGCESTLATDPLNCGLCGKSCLGGTCTGGVCSAPPDGG